MFELWKDVVDYETLYQISNLGNFRRHPDKQSKDRYRTPKGIARRTAINHFGYKYATLSKDGKSTKKTVHQLVAVAFIPKCTYGAVINHIDGNKLNNCVSNLELSNSVHNNTHAHAIGLAPKPGKSIYRNVSTVMRKGKKAATIAYTASVKINSLRHFIGWFRDEIEAAKAVDAYLNLIGDTQRKRNFP